MRHRVPPDPHAYYREFGSWRSPADKHIPRPINPPYGHSKFPAWSELTRVEKTTVVAIVVPLFALGGILRLVQRDLLGARRVLR